MACISGLQKKDGMRGFIFAERCREGTGVPSEFIVGHTGKKHVILPLCGRQGADGVS